MSRAVHQFEIRGVDHSAPAFASIASRAKASASQIRSLVGGALAGVGAYLSFNAVKDGVNTLGHLSDIAQKTSTSVDELTAAAAAMDALGIQNMGVGQLGKAFDYMAKTTGRTGMEGFYKTIEELGKIDDVAQRGQAAMQIFGESGMELMPLVNAADTGVEALRTVVDAMPKVSQAAANAGDGAADAFGFAQKQIQAIWLEGLGFLANTLNNDYTGDVRTAALKAGNYLEYYTKVAVAKCISLVQKFRSAWSAIGTAIGGAIGGFSVNGWKGIIEGAKLGWEQGLREYELDAEEIDKTEEARAERFKAAYEKRTLAIQKYKAAQDDAAVSIDAREKKDAEQMEDAARRTQVRNDLVMGGSNEVTKMQIIGPTLQNETKKQTKILEKIAANTEKTADNTGDAADDEYGVVN